MSRRPALPRLTVPLALMAALAACGTGDARLDKLAIGIGGDSAMKLMGAAKPKRTDPFLTGGHYIEVLYFEKPGASDTADRQTSPLVVIDGKLAGWGWTYLDSLAGPNRLPVAPK